MDSLLEELKAKQVQRNQMTERKVEVGDGLPQPGELPASVPPSAVPNYAGMAPGLGTAVSSSASSGAGSGWGAGGASAAADELASLLFLRELPGSTNEDAICSLFSRYGIVTAVDLVRSPDDNRVKGYVMMDSRESAQRAKDALHDREVDGVPLWIEWSKTHLPQGEHFPTTLGWMDGRPRLVVVDPPGDAKKRRLIDRLARYVASEGHQFEQVIMERESPEGAFSFLFQRDTPEHNYYRWRTFAFAQRDNLKVWRTQTFRLSEGGRWWRPPPCEAAAEAAEKKRNSKFSSFGVVEEPPVPVPAPPPAPNPATAVKASKGSSVMPSSWSQADIDEELERQRLEERAAQERRKRDRNRTVAGGKRLSDEEWGELEQLLRSVTSSRASVLEAMVFCMDKSDWAIEIAETVTESLTIAETEIPLKVARLLVVSDILHNTTSAKPAAWTYRREFEKSLPDIFEQFEIGLSRSESKIQVAQAREQVARILKVWEDWGLFPPQFLRGLEASVMIGVRRLRALASKGDASREPPWLEPKLADWRRQHFSQLEKMCRSRGLRGSTSHLESSPQLSLEEARKEWLIDRLVTYELLAHEKEQARMQAAKDEAAARLARRKSRGMEDIDGEDLADGFPMDDAELDGEPLNLSTPGEIYEAVELAKQAPEALASYLGTVGATEELLGGFVLGAALATSAPASEEVVSVISAEESASSPQVAQDEAQDQEMLDIQRGSPEAAESGKDEAPGQEPSSESHQNLLRDIDLEVMELRASLELKGVHRDAIQDACKKKRKEMLEEHDAKRGEAKQADQKPQAARDTVDPKEREKEKEREKKKKQQEDKAREAKEAKDKEERQKKEKEKQAQEKERQRKEKEKEKEKDKDRDKEKEREREKGKEKAKTKDSEKDAKQKDKDNDKNKDKEKDKEKEKSKQVKKRSPASKSPSGASKKVRR